MINGVLGEKIEMIYGVHQGRVSFSLHKQYKQSTNVWKIITHVDNLCMFCSGLTMN